MKIYVASSWRNFNQPQVVAALRSWGHEVYDFRNPPHGYGGFSWAQIDANWQNWSPHDYINALEHSLAVEGYVSDFAGMEWAECCVLLLPCGRSAHAEAGFMSGSGKPVFVFLQGTNEPELMYKLFAGVVTNYIELAAVLEKVGK